MEVRRQCQSPGARGTCGWHLPGMSVGDQTLVLCKSTTHSEPLYLLSSPPGIHCLQVSEMV